MNPRPPPSLLSLALKRGLDAFPIDRAPHPALRGRAVLVERQQRAEAARRADGQQQRQAEQRNCRQGLPESKIHGFGQKMGRLRGAVAAAPIEIN